jgi:two-component system, sensor histidine kinase and response regulator
MSETLLQQPYAKPQAAPSRSSPELLPIKVLIVEDEVELAEILEHNLRKNGFSTTVAHDGLTACRLVGQENPDIILLDIMLPDLDGWEICRMVRSHPEVAIARTPIIMLTALATVGDRLRGLELGADAYIPKPYSPREVVIKARQLALQHQEWLQREAELVQLRGEAERIHDWQHLLFHELRSQLTIISGYARRLKSPLPENGDLHSDRCLEAIDRSSSYLAELTEECWLVQQIEAEQNQLSPQAIDVEDLLRDVLAIHQGSAQTSHCRVALDLAPVPLLLLNPTGLKLILSNLLNNALKYGQGTEVRITLTAQDGGCRIQVSDQGPGIPEDELERIFTKFYRGEQTRERFIGAGLGLYTAQTLTKAMGGRLTATSEAGAGSCFTLSFGDRSGLLRREGSA